MRLISIPSCWRVVWLASLMLALPLTGLGSRMATHIYDLQVDDTHQPIRMVVEYSPQQTIVTFFNEHGSKEVTTFANPHRPLGTLYYDAKRRLTVQSIYDYEKKRLRIKGDTEANYPIEGDIFDNSGAMFYIFSIYYPEPGKKITFKLAQCDLSYVTDPFQRMLITRMVGPVKMYLKQVRTEILTYNDKEWETEVYQLGIHDGATAAFWPQKYYLWYARDTRLLLQYHGTNAQKKKTIYRLVDYYEWKKPEPDLPTL